MTMWEILFITACTRIYSSYHLNLSLRKKQHIHWIPSHMKALQNTDMVQPLYHMEHFVY